jgi:hypothetical protein
MITYHDMKTWYSSNSLGLVWSISRSNYINPRGRAIGEETGLVPGPGLWAMDYKKISCSRWESNPACPDRRIADWAIAALSRSKYMFKWIILILPL